jgi:ATP-dependent Lhr-like helicase
VSGSVWSRFAPRLQDSIASRLGWTALRPVQELAGAAILDGKNAVVLAPTAGGKTEAAMFPTLSMLIDHQPDGVGAIYLAPIKALLNNQADRLGLYTEMVGLRRFLWHGDIEAPARRGFVAEPSELLMTTPESLEVMLASSKVPAPKLFRDLRIVIIDEIHALAGTDRGAHLMSVLERIADHSQHDVQRVGLSATVGNPDVIGAWMRGTSARDGVVIDPPKLPARRQIAVHLEAEPTTLATRAAEQAKGKKSLFFCESRALTESVADRMRDREIDVFVHHSSVSLAERRLAEERFAGGGSAAIVCTSTLELGIDIGDLDHVFQSNAPGTVSSFLQRMGRTGRREHTTANTTFFCDNPESVLQAVALVELAREGWVESIPPQQRCWPVLVHQLLAFTLAAGGISRDFAWGKLSRLPDLAGISRFEFDQTIDFMVLHDFLFESSGLLSMGEAAERTYGRKNFLELYAVFSSPQYYRVIGPGGADIGSLEQGFVDNLVEDMTSFLLGGRAWLVQAIDHKQRTVAVAPSPRGKQPSWGGFAPRMLGFEVCQRIKQLLCETTEHAYLSESAAAALQLYREDFAALLQRGNAIQLSDDGARWWTYAGGRINQTLRHAIAEMTGWKVGNDNFRLRFEGDGVSHAAVTAAITALAAPGVLGGRRAVAAHRRADPAVPVQQVPGGAAAAVRARARRAVSPGPRRCAPLPPGRRGRGAVGARGGPLAPGHLVVPRRRAGTPSTRHRGRPARACDPPHHDRRRARGPVRRPRDPPVPRARCRDHAVRPRPLPHPGRRRRLQRGDRSPRGDRSGPARAHLRVSGDRQGDPQRELRALGAAALQHRARQRVRHARGVAADPRPPRRRPQPRRRVPPRA